MGDPTDDELIADCLGAQQAAASAFEQLYARHAGPVLGFVRGLTGADEHAARDVLQETFFRFYRALPAFDRARPLRPWLLRIARNAWLDQRKKAAGREVLADPEVVDGLSGREAPGPGAQAERAEASRALRSAVADLPEGERAVFLLKHDQGMTYAEVADALACSVRTAKYRMKAALERLGRAAELQEVIQ